MSVKLILAETINREAQCIKDTKGGKTTLALSENCIGIGAGKFPKAKLHLVDKPRNSNGNTLIIGEINNSNLRLGYHKNYTWIQSHGLRPLYINELGNNVVLNKTAGNVGVGVECPTSKFEVDGDIKAKGLTLQELNSAQAGTELALLVVDEKGKFYRQEPKDNPLLGRIEKLEAVLSNLTKELAALKKATQK